MRRKKCKVLGPAGFTMPLAFFCLLSVATAVSCKGKTDAGVPAVEKALELPAIQRGGEGILVAYRHSGFGFAEANGFDTLIYRFTRLPGGWLDGAVVHERRLEGEKEIGRYAFSYAGDEVVVTESSEKAAEEIARIKTSREGLEIRGQAERSVLRGSEGSLIIRSISGDYSEEYMMLAVENRKKSLISRSGIVEAEGTYAFPTTGKTEYRERRAGDTTGAEDLQLSLWIDKKGDCRFRTEGVAPINEVYAAGLKEALAGDRGLLNLALVDLVLGNTRNIRAALACILPNS